MSALKTRNSKESIDSNINTQKEFKYSLKQKELLKMVSKDAKSSHIMAYGGGRSGKTFALICIVIMRALLADGTRHGVFRSKFNALKNTIVAQTLPAVMKIRFPGIPYTLNKTDLILTFPNGSEIYFCGLDEGDRTEKILGMEFSTIYLNECSLISFHAREMAVTRLTQKSKLKLFALYDCNPPSTSHWTYKLFVEKKDYESGLPVNNPEDYDYIQMNPYDNKENLNETALKQLEGLSEKKKKRFLYGEFINEIDNALWTMDTIYKCRVSKSQLPEMKRIVVAVDPSGCSGKEDYKSDEIGITVCGLGTDGKGYLLADYSGRYSPIEWAQKAIDAYETFEADKIIAEKNYGGSLVESNIRTVRRNIPIKMVTATRGKIIRAEPIASLYDLGKIKHLNHCEKNDIDNDELRLDMKNNYLDFTLIEEQLCDFSHSGYQGSRSPDRADAMIWGFTELMVGGQPGQFESVNINIFGR